MGRAHGRCRHHGHSELIEHGLSKPERILRLNKKAQERLLLLLDSASGQELVKHLEPPTKIRQLGTAQKEEKE